MLPEKLHLKAISFEELCIVVAVICGIVVNCQLSLPVLGVIADQSLEDCSNIRHSTPCTPPLNVSTGGGPTA